MTNRTYGQIIPSADDTAGLQAIINAQAGQGEVVLPAGTWTISAPLVIPSAGMMLRGEEPGAAVLHLNGNFVAITGSGISAPIAISDLVVTGSAPNWDGATVNMTDAGQGFLHLTDCTNTVLSRLNARNISGTAYAFEAPSSGFNIPAENVATVLDASNCYRAMHTSNSYEYASFAPGTIRGCIFGALIESGNITIANYIIEWCYTGVQIFGRANSNPGHATFSGCKINHCFYILDIDGDQLGSSFTGCDLIGDPGGSLTTGGVIRITDSKMVNINGGMFGANLNVQQADVVGGDTAKSGGNILQNVTARDDIPGFVAPVIGAGAKLLCKNNMSASTGALVTWNN